MFVLFIYKCLEIALLAHTVSVCVTLQETVKLFSKVAIPFYNLTKPVALYLLST